jgi:hypothetical protein
LIVVLCFFFGGFIGVAGAFLKSFFESKDRDADEKRKVEAIRESFSIRGIARSARKSVGLGE